MIKTLADLWWLVVIRGLVALIFGLGLIAYPIKTVLVVTVIVGLWLMIDGVISSIVSLFQIKKNEHWWVLLLKGIVGILVGAAIFSWPGITIKALFLLMTLWFLLMGILFIVTAIIIRKESEMEWLVAATGITSLILGVLLYGNPYASVVLFSVVVGLFALVSGITTTVFGIKLHGIKRRIKKAEA